MFPAHSWPYHLVCTLSFRVVFVCVTAFFLFLSSILTEMYTTVANTGWNHRKTPPLNLPLDQMVVYVQHGSGKYTMEPLKCPTPASRIH